MVEPSGVPTSDCKRQWSVGVAWHQQSGGSGRSSHRRVTLVAREELSGPARPFDLGVGVKAATRLAAQQSRVDHTREKWWGCVKRFLELLVKRLRDRLRGI